MRKTGNSYWDTKLLCHTEFKTARRRKKMHQWYDTSFQNPLLGKTGREGEKNSLLIQILTPLLPALFPFQSLFSNRSVKVQITARRRATTGEMKYFTLSPGFPLRLKSCALPPFTGSAQLQHVLPWDCTHVNARTHAQAQAHTFTQRTKEETKYPKRGEETRFGMSLTVFYSYIILFCPPTHTHTHPLWQETGRLEQSDVTLCWGLYSARLLLICKLT